MVELGAGWRIHHLTDRAIELRKDDVAYRQYTGRDGYVRQRMEPGMDRAAMLHKAVELAKRNDAMLAEKMAQQIVPQSIGRYQAMQHKMAQTFGTPEDPELIGVKRA